MKEERRKKKEEEKEVGALNIAVLLGYIEASIIKYKNSIILFAIDLWELALQKLEEIPIPSNPPDATKNGEGNMNMEESKKVGEKGSSGTECSLSKIEKLAIPSRVTLLQSTNIWVGDFRASVHCTNNKCGGSNISKGNGEAMTASSIIDVAGTWCNKFGEEQIKAMLKDVQYNPKSNLNLSSIREAIKEGLKLSGDQENLVLMKSNAKLVFNNKITAKNGVMFYAYLWREHKIAAILAITDTTMSIEKAHMMTGHHDEKQTCGILLELGLPLKKGQMMPCKAMLCQALNSESGKQRNSYDFCQSCQKSCWGLLSYVQS